MVAVYFSIRYNFSHFYGDLSLHYRQLGATEDVYVSGDDGLTSAEGLRANTFAVRAGFSHEFTLQKFLTLGLGLGLTAVEWGDIAGVEGHNLSTVPSWNSPWGGAYAKFAVGTNLGDPASYQAMPYLIRVNIEWMSGRTALGPSEDYPIRDVGGDSMSFGSQSGWYHTLGVRGLVGWPRR